jgi:Asp-tRNA(Asn)/Glu-tRNA(Gln) amidotransferase A subunit family amidase
MTSALYTTAEAIRDGRRTPSDILEECLVRIDLLEPWVKAWVVVDRENARQEAKRLTEEVQRGHWRGPLHGVPIGIKDIIDVFDLPTTCGSRRWAHSYARRDATVVRRLREAGAVIVGKTVTTGYASFDPPPTRNPWDASRTPGGSSSGSAAAVACGMCLGAVGSQTGGSITRPASYCGVAGCKPTFGRVSVDGALPLAPSMDHVGALARSVRDLAILLQTIAGADPRDPTCSNQPVPDWPAMLSRPLSAPRIGRVRGLFADLAEPLVRSLMDQVEDKLRSRGSSFVDVALPAGLGEVLFRHRIIMAVEAAAYHELRLARYPEDYGPQIRDLLNEGLACPAPEFARCQEHQRRMTQEMAHCFGEVDVLLTPAATGPAPDAATTGNPAFNSPWSYTGLPTVSLVAGWTAEGLPLAIQLVAPAWEEARLFAAAAWCEDVLEVEPRQVKPRACP